MKVTAREKRLLSVGMLVLIFSVIFYFLSDTLIPSQDDLSRNLGNSKRLLLGHRELLSQEASYRERSEEYQRRLERTKERLLAGSSPSIAGAELQRLLKELSDQYGVEIIRRDIQREQKVQDNLVKVSVRIETNCTPEQLVQLLSAVENYEKYLTVNELVINSFRIQKKYRIRPSITVSGYILEEKAVEEEQPTTVASRS